MYVTREMLLQELPPFLNQAKLINQDQEVHDIINEVVEAHKYFASDYDLIFEYFDAGTIEEICRNLYNFLRRNVRYQVEAEENQTTKSPSAIIAMMAGDCKHYAGFIAGVLSAINRNTNRGIKWQYRFASYSAWSENMEHVFVVVNDRGKEIWIDPVLSVFDTRNPKPAKILNKKISDQMLNRISGMVGNLVPIPELIADSPLVSQTVPFDSSYLIANAQTQNVNLAAETLQPDFYDENLSANLIEDIKMLLYYGILDQDLKISNDKYLAAMEGLQGQDQIDLGNAMGDFMDAVNSNVIGSIFSSVWGSVKQITLAIPRGAYLSLVSLNVFNLAGHLHNCITNADGSADQAGIDKLWGVWHAKLSGDTNILLRAIRNGAGKKAILGIGAAPAAAAWAATAAVIIAAMTPIITSILKSKNSFSALTASQLAMQPTSLTPGGSTATSSLTQYLPFILLAGVVYYTQKK